MAERDTWKAKEEAARAYLAGTASDGQAAMLAAEAHGAGVVETDLAAAIIAKADAFLELAGIAAGLRAKARVAINLATSEEVPLAEVKTQIETVFAALTQEVEVAVAQFQNTNTQEEA